MLSNQQEQFLREYITIGDEVTVCRRLGLDTLQMLDWVHTNSLFKVKKRQAEKYFLSNLEKNITRDSLSSLQAVLRYGERVVTNTRQTKGIEDDEGNVHEMITTKVVQKVSRNVSWAIRQGIQLYMLRKIEENVSSAIATLMDENIIPEQIKEQILAVLETTDSQVQEIFAGNIQNIEIDERMLAEIQSQLLGN